MSRASDNYVYDIFVNGVFHKTYDTLRGTKNAYSRLDNKILKGEIEVSVPHGEEFLAFIRRNPETVKAPAEDYATARFTY